MLDDGGTFVFTGDLDDLWIRDSAAQVHPYLNYITTDSELRRVVEGLVKRHVFYVLSVFPHTVDLWLSRLTIDLPH